MSFKKQIVLTFLIIILTITSIDIICNRYLLDDYYLNNKEHIITIEAEKINDNIDKIKDLNFLNDLERDCNIQNLSILIVDENYNQQLNFYTREDSDRQIERLKENKGIDKKTQIIENKSLNVNYLEIVGVFDNGYYYMIRTPIDSIKDTASLSTIFLIYILIFLLPVSIVILLIITDRITSPLTKLTIASRKISDLDFSEKCVPSGSSEVIELSKNFNKMSVQLEQTIGELKTANTQLKEELGKKEKIEEMRKELMSSISHELKTPIAIISGYSESLKESIEDPEDIAFYADTIYDETQKLSKMVKQILDLNKLEYATNKIKIKNINLNNIINEIIQPMQKVISDKNILFKNNISNNITVWTDKVMFTHILQNYITNAIDHTPKDGTIEINISLIDNKYKISIFNSGSHIEEQYINRIWDKFFKTDKSRNREFGGTGLGLAIVKSYAKTLNQEYGVENKKNGVEFYITAEK